jgi:hypothetical protein
LFCWERKSWTSWLLTLQQKGLGCWKVIKKRWKEKGESFLSWQPKGLGKTKEHVQDMFIFTRTLIGYVSKNQTRGIGL